MKKRKGLKKWLVRFVMKRKKSPTENRRRVGWSLIVLSFLVFCLFLGVLSWMIGTGKKQGVNLAKEALKVHQTTQIVPARRGTIYDRNGTPIAEDSTTYTIYAIIDTNYVSARKEKLYVQSSQFDQVATIFKNRLKMDKKYVKEQLATKNVFQVYFGTKGKGINNQTKTVITEDMKKAGISGIGFSASPSRIYQNGQFASDFIGLAQLKDNEDGSQSLVGQTGLESTMDSVLSGQDGKIVYEKDRQGRVQPTSDIVQVAPVDGQDVYTTLSADLQLSLESNLDAYIKKTQPVSASATIMSAKTGEILATSQRPTFDPDTKQGLENKDFVWTSKLYQTNYEPGSTMKVMTLASAIDNDSFNPNATYVNNTYKIADAEINDWSVNEGKPVQQMTFAQGFAFSSNVGMTMLEQQMGNDKWLNYLSKFKFGYPTRFGMNAEEPGSLPEDNEVSIAMTAFGQAINVTEVQMLRGFSAISNDGAMLEPKFVSGTYDPNTDTARVAEPEIVGNPVSATAAQQTRQYMINVGTDAQFGTLYSQSLGGRIISVDGYNIAVKSGTAQIAENGRYLEGARNHIYSVVAMIPAEDPKFIMYVTVKQPETLTGLEWADIFNPMLKSAMLLDDSLNLSSPSTTLTAVSKETSYKPKKIIGETPGTTADELRRHLVQPIVLGNGSTIKKASFKEGDNLVANQQVLLLTQEWSDDKKDDTTDDILMPDMYNWTKENVNLYAKWMGLTITYKGSGKRAVKQSVDTGTSLTNHKKITITLGE